MIVNGKALLKAAPIVGMETEKIKFLGVSYGLAEAGYDIRLKQDIVFVYRPWYRGGPYILTRDGDERFRRHKGRFTLASSIEAFNMPSDLVGVVHDKSTWARNALSVFNTVIEPKWCGYLTFEFVFHGNEDVRLFAGQGIAQVIFSRLEEQADYGNGKYQNAEDKPQEAL